MTLRTFTLLYGIAFTAIGILGFIPGVTTPHQNPSLAIEAGLGAIFGLFVVNVVHNLIHLAFGIWALGLALGKASVGAMRGYAKAVAVIYLVLALMGVFPFLNTTFGLVPIYGHDIWLHAALGAVAAYFGFVYNADRQAATARG